MKSSYIISLYSPNTHSTPLTAGESGTLSCDYSLSPAVDVKASATWRVNESRVDTSSGDGRISTDGLSLIFSPLTTADSGSYTCSLSLTSNTPHVTIVQGSQQSSEKAITVLSMSTQLYCFICLCHVFFFSQSLRQLCQSLSTVLVHCWLVLVSPSPVL